VLASLRKKGYITGAPSNGRGQYHIRVVKYFNKASVVTPSASEGVHSDTLMPNKASVVTPYQEVKQEKYNYKKFAPISEINVGLGPSDWGVPIKLKTKRKQHA